MVLPKSLLGLLAVASTAYGAAIDETMPDILVAEDLISSAGVGIPDFAQKLIDNGAALKALNTIALLNSYRYMKGGCNILNVKVRQEWRTLSASQRKQYISAVKCMQNKPSLLPEVPGSYSLYDDFTAVHLNLTMLIHNTGNFPTWHRYMMHTYEQELNKCGYKGNLPYWEWGLDVNDLRKSPVFDGSDTSLGSDGEFLNEPGLIITPAPGTVPGEPIYMPPGTGGGCIKSGPFKGLKMRLGPSSMPIPGSTDFIAVEDPMQDNPRCVSRDLNNHIAKTYTSFRNSTMLLLKNKNIEWFQGQLEGVPEYGYAKSLGVHGAGHFSFGRDPGADPFISPGDPVFYLHHAQVDRLYWIWQMLDFPNRQNVAFTTFFNNWFPSPKTTVEDVLDLGPLAKALKIKEVMNTVGNTPLCYVYK